MNRWKNKAAPVFLIAALLVGWEAVVRIREIPLYVLPAPSQVVEALIANRGTLAAHGAVTVAEALAGMAIALLLALVIGIAMDAFPAVKSGVYPVLVVTQTVPMIVLAPILIIYLGFGITPKILTVVLMCFFPIVVSFADAMGQMDEEYVQLVRSFGAGRWMAYRLVKIPAAVPGLISGLKVAATYSISGAVVGVAGGPERPGLLPAAGEERVHARQGVCLRAGDRGAEPLHERGDPPVPGGGHALRGTERLKK